MRGAVGIYTLWAAAPRPPHHLIHEMRAYSLNYALFTMWRKIGAAGPLSG